MTAEPVDPAYPCGLVGDRRAPMAGSADVPTPAMPFEARPRVRDSAA
ncbi:hypothetical protein ACN28C_01790 [Plantactinospora sp. WMMC1484]